ncbi:MAG: hypothetical protein A3E38_03235 [Candidatus Moranbacteria bacterium RIFCSPHIGHO2_12_FULL_54_9]|nr:MAG: hypothetical protein A2878_02735 [Candidatus Moranbacteria bacterium RIFCSPHIGHO2_01_FULL_54_31]OGI24661.1 MAG: hypothetical protein A3E38_03235 [Candidatus Moranbacteria bacterium RIFCSPHIGHO2_12_FULL_54_9]
MKILLLGMDSMTLAILLLVLVFSVGIVWRVEKELDLSYKFFVMAAGCLVLAELIGFSAYPGFDAATWGAGLRMGGAVFLLVSVILMRDLLRKLDGEKEPGNQ